MTALEGDYKSPARVQPPPMARSRSFKPSPWLKYLRRAEAPRQPDVPGRQLPRLGPQQNPRADA